MNKAGEKLLEDALRLGLPDRAELIAELLASLDRAPAGATGHGPSRICVSSTADFSGMPGNS